jgi:DNA-directed RNA polymerase subunit M/transcription elongation factor TFIIS
MPIEEIEESSMNVQEEQTKYVKKRTLKIKYYEIPSTYKKYKINDITNTAREQVIIMFVDILGSQKNAETFEKYIYQSVGNDIEKFENKFKYIETARNLIDYFINLKSKNNLKLSDILDMIKNNKLNFSSDFYEEYKEEIKKELKKSQVPVEVVEGLFPCPKCKSENTQHYSVQTRRSDEPPTIFLECLNKFCLHKWRMG